MYIIELRSGGVLFTLVSRLTDAAGDLASFMSKVEYIHQIDCAVRFSAAPFPVADGLYAGGLCDFLRIVNMPQPETLQFVDKL